LLIAVLILGAAFIILSNLLADILYTFISVNYIGDGRRDAFNPYQVLETVGEYT